MGIVLEVGASLLLLGLVGYLGVVLIRWVAKRLDVHE